MKLREAIDEYANAVSSYYSIVGYGKQEDESITRAESITRLVACGKSLDVAVEVAEAAIALAEYQATSGYDPEVDSMTYTAERGRLWHAFIMARAKAANQS